MTEPDSGPAGEHKRGVCIGFGAAPLTDACDSMDTSLVFCSKAVARKALVLANLNGRAEAIVPLFERCRSSAGRPLAGRAAQAEGEDEFLVNSDWFAGRCADGP